MSKKGKKRTRKQPFGYSPPHKRLYTVDEAAIYLGRTAHAVRELQYAGKLPIVKIDARVFYDVQDLDKLIEISKITWNYE